MWGHKELSQMVKAQLKVESLGYVDTGADEGDPDSRGYEEATDMLFMLGHKWYRYARSQTKISSNGWSIVESGQSRLCGLRTSGVGFLLQ